MRPPNILRTHRLRLRPPLLSDAAVIFQRYAQDREVTRFLMWRPHGSIIDTRVFLRGCLRVRARGTSFPWVIVRKKDGELLGMIELRLDSHRAQIGYVLAKSYWGNGYMTEALKVVVHWCLSQPGIHRIWAFADVENRASCRVLAKAGMKREGILRRWVVHAAMSDKPRDCYTYTIIR
ncbi:MAG TPA: GNAT family N-acetyltransferase [Verrucomicrobiae bacterium]|nr:GNAT family N-acetyltransferase [Verrucomicrobiae bacterium]